MARSLYTNIVTATVGGNLQPLGNIRVTVRIPGSGSAASNAVYQSRTGAAQGATTWSNPSSQGNPFTTGTSGMIAFWAEGEYDIDLLDLNPSPRIAPTTLSFSGNSAEDGGISGAKIANATLNGAKLIDATVPDSKISGLSGAKIAAASLPSSALVSVDGGKVSDNTMNGDKLLVDTLSFLKAAPGHYTNLLGAVALGSFVCDANETAPSLGSLTVSHNGGTAYAVAIVGGYVDGGAGAPVNVVVRLDASDQTVKSTTLAVGRDHTMMGFRTGTVAAGSHTWQVFTALGNAPTRWRSEAGGLLLVFERS